MTKHLAIAALLLSALFVSAAPAPAPPVTDAEKAACEIVAEYLAHGPDAIRERLSSKSPFAALEPESANGEIEARLGPRNTSWELRTSAGDFSKHGAVFHLVFPSGVDDVAVLDLDHDNGKWTVNELRTMAELPKDALAAANVGGSTAALVKSPSFFDHFFFFALGAPLLTILGGFLRRRYPRSSSAILLLALVAIAIPVAGVIDPDWMRHLGANAKWAASGAEAQPGSFIPMRSLVQLRRSVAEGSTLPEVSSQDEDTRDIAVLWKAASSLGQTNSDGIVSQLSALKRLSGAPMASLLRARIAADASRSADAAREYAAIHSVAPSHDAFLFEEMIGRAKTVFDSTVTRDPEVPYIRCIELIVRGRHDDAVHSFQEAWRTRPMSRADLVSAGIFAPLLRDPAVSVLVNLNTPDEQKSADLSLSRTPMRAPDGTKSVASGNFVRLMIGNGVLDIPGGAPIAPAGTTTMSAAGLDRDESAVALNRAEHVNARSLASVATQRTVEAAADVMAEHNQWNRILALTDAVNPDSDNVPASLITWRIRALIRAGRVDDARRLATGTALARAMNRAPDAAALIEVSELLASVNAWDEAIDTMKKAGSIAGAPDVSARLRQLDLRRLLATSPAINTTPHFQIHATADVPATVPERVGQLLEAELVRLSPRFHVADFHPVRVNVVRWDTFHDQLTGSDHIVGFYDGDITVPFGDVEQFRDRVVAILTHELTHAIVAQRSGDNAPRWFQEGIARRSELVETQENIFHTHAAQQFVALELLDPTLKGSIDPEAVSDGYSIASTFMHFLEDSYGTESTNAMIESFRAGSDTEEALHALTGKSVEDVDRQFRTWGLTHTADFIDSTPWPYTQFYSLGVDPKVRQGIWFSHRPDQPKP